MKEQIHKRLTVEQVKTILDIYINKRLDAEHAMNLLDLRRRQFFEWVRRYKEDPDGFTIEYHSGVKEDSQISRRSKPLILRAYIFEYTFNS